LAAFSFLVIAFIILSIPHVTIKIFILNLQAFSLIFALLAATFLSFGLIKDKYQIALEVTTFPNRNIPAARSLISDKYNTKLGIYLFIISILLEAGALACTELLL